MAKHIRIKLADGSTDEYHSTLTRGYHLHEAENGACVTEKRLFQPERVVRCYPKRQVAGSQQERCNVCESINPTQRSDYSS